MNESNTRSLEVWRLIGGRFDWAAIFTVVELYDLPVDDELIGSLQMLSVELPQPGGF